MYHPMMRDFILYLQGWVTLGTTTAGGIKTVGHAWIAPTPQ